MQNEMYHPKKGSIPPLFRNRILDAVFSHAHFSVPLFLYLPLIALIVYRGLWIMDIPVWTFLGLFFAGLFAWTFFEYVLHRWLLHWVPKFSWGETAHFWLHGIHHDYPSDTRVVPPGRSLPAFGILWTMSYFALGPESWHAPLSGFMLGYIWYEMIHYAVHNSSWKNKTFRKFQTHHMYHHYRNHDSSFSFTGIFWDRLFRTRFEDMREGD